MTNATKAALEASLKKLLLKKPLDKITINDLTTECGISRMAFYYHFKDIPDVVEFILKKKWDEILEAPQKKTSILECMEEMASLVRDNRKLMLNVYKSVKRDTFLVYMNEIATYIITEYFKKNLDKFDLNRDEISILIKYYKCLFIGILMEWLNNALEDDLGVEMRQAIELMNRHPELTSILNKTS